VADDIEREVDADRKRTYYLFSLTFLSVLPKSRLILGPLD